MAHVTPDDIKAMGFSAAMYGIDEETLTSRIADVISECEAQLAARVGQAAMDNPDNAAAVSAVIRRSAAVEMAWRRVVALSANTQISAAEAQESDGLRKAIWRWDQAVEGWVLRIRTGDMTDGAGFASSVTVSSSSGRMDIP